MQQILHEKDLAKEYGAVCSRARRRDVRTTMIYTHVPSQAGGRRVRSPLERLEPIVLSQERHDEGDSS